VSDQLLTSLAIFTLAILVGFEVISKVPATLHTPLMSGANSIHGIVLVGAMIIASEADNPVSYTLAFVAMVFGAMNVVGGYVVTDRMLQMFRKKPTAPKATTEGADGDDHAGRAELVAAPPGGRGVHPVEAQHEAGGPRQPGEVDDRVDPLL